ncbi:IS200/IS605 family transposase [Sporolactobacillus sp. Y61]|uniref:IS200/IS605 family transposase n=1 Tax=Sporolactobacillus sp. Y61 TaxID=3160863 RepID=A0AAU8IJW4_9BACL|nr:IS200/IS605 family transposase [Sporolactobacillus sp. THM19-2]RYL88450.1 IS200/IS605 family transposase [Sporolactobacillus sp. THM19-2]
MSEVKHGRGYVYSIQYHIVWCVKYRHQVLVNHIENGLKEILYNIADENDFTISELEVNKDHVHLLVDCTPQQSIPNMIKSLKGTSARMMFKRFPELKNKLWGGNLWNPSYFVATVSENTEEQVREYIRNQKKK